MASTQEQNPSPPPPLTARKVAEDVDFGKRKTRLLHTSLSVNVAGMDNPFMGIVSAKKTPVAALLQHTTGKGAKSVLDSLGKAGCVLTINEAIISCETALRAAIAHLHGTGAFDYKALFFLVHAKDTGCAVADTIVSAFCDEIDLVRGLTATRGSFLPKLYNQLVRFYEGSRAPTDFCTRACAAAFLLMTTGAFQPSVEELAAFIAKMTMAAPTGSFFYVVSHFYGAPKFAFAETATEALRRVAHAAGETISRHATMMCVLFRSVSNANEKARAAVEWMEKTLVSVSACARDEISFWDSVVSSAPLFELLGGDAFVQLDMTVPNVLGRMLTNLFKLAAEPDEDGKPRGKWIIATAVAYYDKFASPLGGQFNINFPAYTDVTALFVEDVIIKHKFPPCDAYKTWDTSAALAKIRVIDKMALHILKHAQVHHDLFIKSGAAGGKGGCGEGQQGGDDDDDDDDDDEDVVMVEEEKIEWGEEEEEEEVAVAPIAAPACVHTCVAESAAAAVDTSVRDTLGIAVSPGEPEPLFCGTKLPEGRRAPTPDIPAAPKVSVSETAQGAVAITISVSPGPTESMRKVCVSEIQFCVKGNNPKYKDWCTLYVGPTLTLVVTLPPGYLRCKAALHDFRVVFHGPGGSSPPSATSSATVKATVSVLNGEREEKGPSYSSSSSAVPSPTRTPLEVLQGLLSLRKNPGGGKKKKNPPTVQQLQTAIDAAVASGAGVDDETVSEAMATVAKAAAAKAARDKRKKRGTPAPIVAEPRRNEVCVHKEKEVIEDDDDDDDDKNRCVVCTESIENVITAKYPCGHETCFACASKWANTRNGIMTTCPTCRRATAI